MRAYFFLTEGIFGYLVVSLSMLLSSVCRGQMVCVAMAMMLLLSTPLAMLQRHGGAVACCHDDADVEWLRADVTDVTPGAASGRPAVVGAASWPGIEPIYWDGRVVRRRATKRSRRKVRRSRAEIKRERKELFDKTRREIDALVAEFHEELSRSEAKAIGSCYARFSSRFQDSIVDQVRTLLEAALKLKIFIPREHIYFDMAVRGFQDRRPGLTALRKAMKEKQFDVFLVFTTSRLFRRTYKALQFVEEELVERGIRGVFLKSGIDTGDDKDWRTMFQVLATMDEAMVRMYASHVRASHEGLFIRGMVFNSLPLGFTGEVVPGEFTKRKLPRRRIVVDPETLPWVIRIFEWYVVDGKKIDEIVRELNDDPNAPAPPRSLTGLWTRRQVRSVLLDPRYRGFWCYGATEAKWSSEKDYAQQIPRSEPLKSGQFDNLRIISDEMSFKAEELIATEIRNSGRKPKDGDRRSRPQLLRQLFCCPEHGRRLVVGGPNGRILFCPVCRAIKAEKRPLFTYLNRALATRLTCQKLAELVRADEQLAADIVAACQREAERAQRPDPATIDRLRAQADRLAKKIAFNRRNPGDTPEEEAETEKLLKELQAERAKVMAELAAHEAAQKRGIVPPTQQEALAMLADLERVLIEAAGAESDEKIRIARRIIDELTGGRIELFQMGQRKARRGWLQARFHVRLLSVLTERMTGVSSCQDDGGLDVVIDYREPPKIDVDSERAKELYDQGLMNAEIARRLGCSRSRVTALLKHWFKSNGLKMPDGRSRRASLKKKHVEPPLYQEIADDVMALWHQGVLLQDIADRLRVDRNTVTATVRWWHEDHDLPVPDGRTRRKGLDRKTSSKSGDSAATSPPQPPTEIDKPADDQ